MNLSTFATEICVLRRHARLGNAVLLAMALAAPVAAQQPAPSPPTIYGFSLGYAPSGAIVTSRDSLNGNWSYSYDSLNRLATAARGGGVFTYDYDRNGNRWRQTSSDGQGPSPQFDFDTTTNHIVGMAYDALGNIINDRFHTYTYDAENRLIKVDDGAVAEYAYDALGRRVRKGSAGGATSEYLFDLAGRVTAERDGATGLWNRREVYAARRHVATYARDTTYFHHQDWLGSNRVTTLPDATTVEQCSNLPFGDGHICVVSGNQASTSTPFADYERDPETNLDHTWFRQYSSTQGRWTTPDPSLESADPSNPQSLNRYSYVLNDPLRLVDPLGLSGEFCVYMADDGVNEEERDYDSNEGECRAHGGIWSGPVFDHTEQGPWVNPVFWDPTQDRQFEIPYLLPGGALVFGRDLGKWAAAHLPSVSVLDRPLPTVTCRMGPPDPPTPPQMRAPESEAGHALDRIYLAACLVMDDITFGWVLDSARCRQEAIGKEGREAMPLYHETEVNPYQLENGPTQWFKGPTECVYPTGR